MTWRAPVTDHERLEVLRRWAELNAEHDRLMWDAITMYHHAGVPAEAIAGVLGMAVSTFYRRVSQHAESQD